MENWASSWCNGTAMGIRTCSFVFALRKNRSDNRFRFASQSYRCDGSCTTLVCKMSDCLKTNLDLGMSCALRKNKGSGYVKPSVGSNALKESLESLESLKASRDAQINRLFPPLTASAVKPLTSCTAPIPPISRIPLSQPREDVDNPSASSGSF